MATGGFDEVLAHLAKWHAAMQAKAATAMEVVAAALEGWAKTEHGHPGGPVGVTRRVRNGVPENVPHSPPFWDETGATTTSIRGAVTEVSAELIRTVLTAGMDYDVFLELVRDGKWAFLWPTLMNHKEEILAMIEKGMSA